ncbi:MAG: hypothetical protein PHF60_05065 [Candidatus ainarchaeum sp.]|nr:hypothetical protein [Candidatus ainarchaeum sp.]
MTKMNGKDVYGPIARLLAAAQSEHPALVKARGVRGTPLVDSLAAVVDKARRSGTEIEVKLPSCPLSIISATNNAVDDLLSRPNEVRRAVGKGTGNDILVALRNAQPELDTISVMVAMELTANH